MWKTIDALFAGFWEKVRQILNPPKAFSWQSLLLACLVLWGLALGTLVIQALPWIQDKGPLLLQDRILADRIASISLFLLGLSGFIWAIETQPVKVRGISLGSWFAAAIFCWGLFVFLANPVQVSAETARFLAIVSWPLIAAITHLAPILLTAKPKFFVPPARRIPMLIFVLIHVLVTFWIWFCFVVNDWASADMQRYTDWLEAASQAYQNDQDLPPSPFAKSLLVKYFGF
jgi:hypothetical protein